MSVSDKCFVWWYFFMVELWLWSILWILRCWIYGGNSNFNSCKLGNNFIVKLDIYLFIFFIYCKYLLDVIYNGEF